MRTNIKIIIATMFITLMLTATAFAAKPVINADRTYFDISSGQYVLNGNVHIEVGHRLITAGQARVNMATLEVWAEGGVTVTQDDIYFAGDSVYVYAKDHAQINGGVSLTRSGLKIMADSVDYNWRSKIATFSGGVQVEQNGNSWTANSLTYNVTSNSFL